MGQASSVSIKDILLTATDRLVARNADGGLSPLASHVVLFGESAGRNLGDVDHIYVIGSDSLKGGLANAAQEGTVVYGANNLSAFNGTNIQAQLEGPNLVIGFDNAPQIVGAASTLVLVGSRIAHDAPALQSNLDASVIIGYAAMERQRTAQAGGGTFCRRGVVIGYQALRGKAYTIDGAGTGVNESIFIGAQAGENAGVDVQFPGGQIVGVVCLGTRAMQNVNGTLGTSTTDTIAIGSSCVIQLRSNQRSVFIGSGITCSQTDTADDVMLGALLQGDAGANTFQNVVIGARASVSALGSRNLLLGSGANALTTLATVNDNFLVETVDSTSNVRRNLMYGKMGTLTGAAVTSCGLVIGLSDATNRDLPGMNILKIVNGGRDAGLTAPLGGGYFYVAAGALHWVGSANTDTVIAPA